MTAYPEHEKLAKVKDQSQVIGEFLEWALSEKGYGLAEQRIFTEANTDIDGDPVEGTHETQPHMVWVHESIEKLLAEFFEIDLNKLEAEKRAMLEEMRRVSG